MRAISKTELRELAAHGDGAVLVDRRFAGDERISTLHHVACTWPRKTSTATPLLYATSLGSALRWLNTNRGEEGGRWKRCRDCRGMTTTAAPGTGSSSASTAGPSARSPRVVGQPVWVTDRGRDLGVVVTSLGESVEVAEFDSTADPAARPRRVAHDATSPFLPRAGDRCFVERAGTWTAATCLDDVADPDALVSVAIDGERLDALLTDVRFRPLHVPASLLSSLGDTRGADMRRHRARARFVADYWSMASASQGLLGVSSSAVTLYPHQVGVARRVLADPVQRYLLADEVGLGKTIEAGFIIRQRLIDAPGSIVVVLVPEALVWQWEEELQTKFGVHDLRRGGVEVVSFEAARAFDRIQVPDLVVIDEAHRVAAGWKSDAKELSERFEAAQTLAHRVPRILLLSATPVLHREADLLAMLHLLDPDTYRLDELDAFKARVADRERIGEMLLALRPGARAFLLRSRLPQIAEAFSGDERLAQMLAALTATLDGDPADREEALADARAHLSDTYRLHRRLLRNRREALERTSYDVRGRAGLVVLDDGDSRRPAVDDWLERWRLTLLEDAYEAQDEDATVRAAEAFLVYLQCATGDLESLRAVVEFKLTWKRTLRDAAGLSPDDAARVRAFPISERQRAVLAELDALLGEPDDDLRSRARGIADVLLGLDDEVVVVFASSAATAVALGYHLELAGETAGLYTTGKSDSERRATALAFIEGTGRRFLICDRTGEEGLNLQVADCIVHADLPLSTTRIEQRIGRVDRHGAPRPVRNYVVSPGPPPGGGDWWLTVLSDGFKVFDKTTAPIQYAIESVERELLLTLASAGSEEASRASASLEERVAEEQARIDKLDSLDALAREETDDVEFVNAVRAAEQASAGAFSKAVFAALDVAQPDLGMTTAPREAGGRVVRLSRSPPALRVFSGVAGRELMVSANRKLAVTDSELSLLRPGAPLVEALRVHLDWDDRGQTATIWADQPDRVDSIVAVRCDLIVRADSGPAFATWNELEMARPRTREAVRTDADAPLAVGALQRRLDAYLPPRLHMVWVDESGQTIVDESTLEALDAAYATAAGAPWSAVEWARVARHCGVLSMDDVLAHVSQAVEAAVVADDPTRRASEHASARARSDWDYAERSLRLRSDLGLGSASADRDLATERAVGKLLLDALATPVAQWSSAAIVFINGDGDA